MKHVRTPFDIYLITDGTGEDPEGLLLRIESALKGGVRAVQLREKRLGAAKTLCRARRLRELTKSYGARLFINDRIDIAILSEADGIHLTTGSVLPSEARKLLGPQKLIGSSAHSLKEALEAEAQGADFITFGPVFYTPSKASYGEPVGLQSLEEVVNKVLIPVYALGGIKAGNLGEVLDKGVSGVAVISAILSATDIEKSARSFAEVLKAKQLP